MRSESKTILIVDDDAAFRNSLADILRDEGYNPVTAGTCAEALKIARQKKPGAALLDLKLPDGAGTSLLASLKSLDPNCICTIVTAYADLDSAVAALNKGAFQYLQKPVKPVELLNLLKKIFDLISLRDAKYLAEQKLKENEERFRTIFETARDAIFMKDRDRKYVLINPKAEEFFGFSTAELLGQTAEELLDEENATIVKAFDNRILAGETVEEERDGLVNGDPRKFHLIGVPIEDASRQIVGICAITRDITEKLKMEAQFAQAQKMEAIGTIAGGIAHDFNNILGSIVGYSELALLDLSERSPTKSHLEAILLAAKRATELVKQILAFSHQNGQKVKPTQIFPVVETCLKIMRTSLPATINIHQNIVNDSGVINANSTEIQQVLMNLITNAAHAMSQKGGDLTVSLENIDLDFELPAISGRLNPGPYIVLTVKDTGHGMDETTRGRIFDPYFTTKDKEVGTGLGLAVVLGIVAKANGSVTVESKPGVGATFKVFLPRLKTETVERKRSDLQKPLPHGQECILFVDDEWSLVNIGQQMLKKLGYKVIGRTNPLEALESFRAQPDKIDIVVTDQTMPEMTGEILARQIMQLKPGIPVIICSGFSESMNKEKARSMGIRKFIMKPMVMMELAESIRQILDESS